MVEKRRSGRQRISETPVKRTRLSSQIKQEETPETSPERDLDKHQKEEVKPILLPNRVYENRALPTLPHAQSANLPDDEYQSIESSRALSMSLHRSRQRWMDGDFFERYWTKGKKATQPVNNPSKTSMVLIPSSTSSCTLIIEPIILEARVYSVRDLGTVHATAPKSQMHPYGTPYRSNGVHEVNGSSKAGKTMNSPQGTPGGMTGPNQAQTKAPDPVIQLLAQRASSDPALKELMKIVATGQGTQSQLQMFQRHIDELNVIAEKLKVSDNASAASSPASTTTPQRTLTPQPQPAHATAAPRPLQQSGPRPRATDPSKCPVVLEFLDQGASADRFLFPQQAIVESLGSQSMLASFLVIRKGKAAADPALFDPEVDYYEPVTVKIDVRPGDSEVLQHIKRSVKPVEEARKWMEEKIRTCKRAELRHLAMRLPVRSQLTEAEEEAYIPPPPVEVKKRGPYKKKADKEREAAEKEAAAATTAEGAKKDDAASASQISDVKVEEPARPESSREGERRAIKRSARLIEAMAG